MQMVVEDDIGMEAQPFLVRQKVRDGRDQCQISWSGWPNVAMTV